MRVCHVRCHKYKYFKPRVKKLFSRASGGSKIVSSVSAATAADAAAAAAAVFAVSAAVSAAAAAFFEPRMHACVTSK